MGRVWVYLLLLHWFPVIQGNIAYLAKAPWKTGYSEIELITQLFPALPKCHFRLADFISKSWNNAIDISSQWGFIPKCPSHKRKHQQQRESLKLEHDRKIVQEFFILGTSTWSETFGCVIFVGLFIEESEKLACWISCACVLKFFSSKFSKLTFLEHDVLQKKKKK